MERVNTYLCFVCEIRTEPIYPTILSFSFIDVALKSHNIIVYYLSKKVFQYFMTLCVFQSSN